MFTWRSIRIRLNGVKELASPGTIVSQEHQRVLRSEESVKFKKGKSIILKAARVSSLETAIQPCGLPDPLSNSPKIRRK